MNRIEAVFFDYGETLIHEHYFDPKKGTKAVLKYSNQPDFDVGLIQELAGKFSKIQRSYIREGEDGNYIEITNSAFQHFLYDYYGIQLQIDDCMMQEVFWNHAAPYELIEGSDEILRFLKQQNIKIGVISNIAFSSEMMKKRLKDSYPSIEFDIVVTSGDYGIRKPNALIFEVACKKAKVDLKNVLFVGDSYVADYQGSINAGMRAILVGNGSRKLKDIMEMIDYEIQE